VRVCERVVCATACARVHVCVCCVCVCDLRVRTKAEQKRHTFALVALQATSFANAVREFLVVLYAKKYNNRKELTSSLQYERGHKKNSL